MPRPTLSSLLMACLAVGSLCLAPGAAAVQSDAYLRPEAAGSERGAAGGADAPRPRAQSDRRPNIVLLLTDDQDAVMGVSVRRQH